MRNILSYQNGQFTGEEITKWAQYQVENKTSNQKAGRYILNHFHLLPQRLYKVQSSYSGTGCGERVHKPLVLKV